MTRSIDCTVQWCTVRAVLSLDCIAQCTLHSTEHITRHTVSIVHHLKTVVCTCTVHTWHFWALCTGARVHSPHSILSKLHSIHYSVLTNHYILKTLITLHTTLSTISIVPSLHSPHSPQNTYYSTLSTVHPSHSPHHTLYNTLSTLNYPQYTIYTTLFALHSPH